MLTKKMFVLFTLGVTMQPYQATTQTYSELAQTKLVEVPGVAQMLN